MGFFFFGNNVSDSHFHEIMSYFKESIIKYSDPISMSGFHLPQLRFVFFFLMLRQAVQFQANLEIRI